MEAPPDPRPQPPPDPGPQAPPGSVVQVCFPSVRTAVLDSLNQQRLEGRLCDLSIQVQRQVFRAHRCVLAASSPYFHDQVLLKNVTTVSLPSVMDPVAFESVLSSAYTGQLSILRDDIVNYVTVASFLQMWHIVDKCTEILKRPRASAESSQGDPAPAASYPPASSSSRQQSPSSTDCLYLEREGSRKERRPDALPPLATWRRPQQFPRCGRPRPAAHPADSQLLGPGGESDYSSCEEVWMSSSKAFSHDGRGGRQEYSQTSSRNQGELQGEGLRLRVRPRQRDPPPGSDRQSGRERGRGEDGGGGGGAFEGQSQEKRRNERWMEADEGIGEVEVEKSVWSQRTEHHGDFNMAVAQGIDGQTEAKVNPDVSLKKEEHEQPHGGPAPEGPLGPLSPGSTPSHRVAWQAGSWSQQGAKPQDRPDAEEDEEEVEEVDFGRFTDGAFGGETYDEIEDGTGQVSQRPLLPASPDNSEFNLGEPEMDWPPSHMVQPGTSTHHLSSSSSAMFPPSLSPPAPHAGAPYRGKVHFCHCGKAYTLKSMRDRHVKMQHLNLRPFGCLVCAKTFKMKHHLTKHLKTHGGLRPYECRLCGKKVIWRDSFLRHQARCERLTASYSDITSACNDPAPSTEMDYGFEGGQGFLAEGGQVKVEEADFQGEVEAGVSGLLGGEAAGVETLEQDSG